MITTIIKQILADSGCTLVLYDQEQLANLYVDESKPSDVIGIYFQPNEVILEVRANAIHEHYNPFKIEILKQARLEDKAENNETTLQELLDICKVVIIRLIAEAKFKTLIPVTAYKILEKKYDANVIGWGMNLNIYYLLNETRNPCL